MLSIELATTLQHVSEERDGVDESNCNTGALNVHWALHMRDLTLYWESG
jgi:hypothetical protein